MKRKYNRWDMAKEKWVSFKPGEAMKTYLDSLPIDTEIAVFLPDRNARNYRVSREVKTQ